MESQIADACSIAHGIWRQAKLPASMLEEMRAEALLILCDCCARHGVRKGKVLCGIQIKGRMIEMIRGWRRSASMPPENDPPAPSDKVDDPRTTLALKLISWLPDRQREVIEMRFGLTGHPPMTNREVAAELGIGDAGASGLHAKAMRKLIEWSSWSVWDSFKQRGGEQR